MRKHFYLAAIHFHLHSFCSIEKSGTFLDFRLHIFPSYHFYFCRCVDVCECLDLAPSLFISICCFYIWNTVFLGRMNISEHIHFHFDFFFLLLSSISGYMVFSCAYSFFTMLSPYSLFSISVLFIISTYFPVFTFNKFHFIEWQKNKEQNPNNNTSSSNSTGSNVYGES